MDNELYSKKNVGKRLKAVRDALEVNQRQFAAEVGMSPQAVNDYEAGRARLSIKAALMIYERYDIDPNWFFLGKVDTLPHKIAVALISNPALK